MNISEILTIVALFLNSVALFYAGYQTHLNKRSVNLAQQAIDQQRRIQQMQLLPDRFFLLTVQTDLERWLQNIEDTADKLESGLRSRDEEALKKITAKALKSPKGLIKKGLYNRAPEWLSAIWVTGAQYYYAFHPSLSNLWEEDEKTLYWNAIPAVISRGKWCSFHLKELLRYVEETLPDAYTNSPGRIDDDDFLSD